MIMVPPFGGGRAGAWADWVWAPGDGGRGLGGKHGSFGQIF
jgi:hypothetical protein